MASDHTSPDPADSIGPTLEQLRKLPKTLPNFAKWMELRGRDPGTVDCYVSDLQICMSHPKGMLGRLRERGLAPKTIRRTAASIRAWIKYSGDTDLLAQLEDILLPKADRVTVKTPLEPYQWKALVDVIDTSYDVPAAERAVLGMMALRGFRIGDVLRMTWGDISTAQRTGRLGFQAKKKKRMDFNCANFSKYIDMLLADDRQWNTVADLIATRTGKIKTASARMAVARTLKSLGEKVGIPAKDMYPHRLRRTYAVMYLDAVGGDLQKLKMHLDWADIATAASYADHDRGQELDNVAANMLETLKKK